MVVLKVKLLLYKGNAHLQTSKTLQYVSKRLINLIKLCTCTILLRVPIGKCLSNRECLRKSNSNLFLADAPNYKVCNVGNFLVAKTEQAYLAK